MDRPRERKHCANSGEYTHDILQSSGALADELKAIASRGAANGGGADLLPIKCRETADLAAFD
jgi:hypothetical protein